MPGHDDEAVGRVEPVAHRHQPVQAGDPDVVDPVDARAEGPGHERRLGRDRRVRGAGRHDAHRAAGLRQRADGDGARHLVDQRVRERLARTAARASSGSRVASAGRPPSCRASSRRIATVWSADLPAA